MQLLQSGSVAMGLMKRGQYDKTTTETQKAKITRYTAENGIAAALCDLKTKQGLELKESTVRGQKKTYCAELASRKEKGMINPWKNCLCKHWDAHWR